MPSIRRSSERLHGRTCLSQGRHFSLQLVSFTLPDAEGFQDWQSLNLLLSLIQADAKQCSALGQPLTQTYQQLGFLPRKSRLPRLRFTALS